MENRPYREKSCNFCDFAEYCRIPDGVVCTEEHHQNGKDRFQYYLHSGCKYFKDEKDNDVYDLEKSRRKWDDDLKKATCESCRKRIKDLEKELKKQGTLMKYRFRTIYDNYGVKTHEL